MSASLGHGGLIAGQVAVANACSNLVDLSFRAQSLVITHFEDFHQIRNLNHVKPSLS